MWVRCRRWRRRCVGADGLAAPDRPRAHARRGSGPHSDGPSRPTSLRGWQPPRTRLRRGSAPGHRVGAGRPRPRSEAAQGVVDRGGSRPVARRLLASENARRRLRRAAGAHRPHARRSVAGLASPSPESPINNRLCHLRGPSVRRPRRKGSFGEVRTAVNVAAQPQANRRMPVTSPQAGSDVSPLNPYDNSRMPSYGLRGLTSDPAWGEVTGILRFAWGCAATLTAVRTSPKLPLRRGLRTLGPRRWQSLLLMGDSGEGDARPATDRRA